MIKKRAKKTFQADEEEMTLLADFLKEQNVKNYDYAIFGDGSGSTFDRGAGWASVSIEKATQERRVWNGGVNRGTVNFAEIMAYVQPLTYLQSVEEKRRALLGRRAVYVHIFTDSEYCRNMGMAVKRTVHKNAVLWAIFDVLQRDGFMLRWHWIRRESVALNCYCDRLSRLSRILHERYNLQERMLADHHDMQTINP